MELTVISGKGGTGKTTVAAALVRLSGARALADCDVDAPNLSLLFSGSDIRKTHFFAGVKAEIDRRFCTLCGRCEQICRFGAVMGGVVDTLRCEGCGACELVCDVDAIKMRPQKSADVYLTRLENAFLSRAEMEIGSDGSGKLVAELRKNARALGEELIIIDGSPGIGCPVISSVTASDVVLIVTEPTQSGFDDYQRVAQLCAHFGVKTLVCVNKHDLNPAVTLAIEIDAADRGIEVVGEIPYDDTVTASINALRPVTDDPDSAAGMAINKMWERLKPILASLKKEEEAME